MILILNKSVHTKEDHQGVLQVFECRINLPAEVVVPIDCIDDAFVLGLNLRTLELRLDALAGPQKSLVLIDGFC
jgi:hypothetical protein